MTEQPPSAEAWELVSRIRELTSATWHRLDTMEASRAIDALCKQNVSAARKSWIREDAKAMRPFEEEAAAILAECERGYDGDEPHKIEVIARGLRQQSSPESFQCPACRWHEGEDPAEWFAEEVKLRSPPAAVVDYTDPLRREAGFYIVEMTAGSPAEPAQWSQALHCWLTCGSKEEIPDRLVDRVVGPIDLTPALGVAQAEIAALKHDIERYQAIAASEAAGHSEAKREMEIRGEKIAEAMGRYRGAEPLIRAVYRLATDYHEAMARLARLREPDAREAVARALHRSMEGETATWDGLRLPSKRWFEGHADATIARIEEMLTP